MNGRAYYNERDPFAAAWLRELIAAGLVCPGDVDERDIRDVRPADLVGYTQCHFFAGIGVWSYALRLAGWPDSRPVWTGSCPCQPFSAAGGRGGFADERHLWPALFHLIRVGRPDTFLGEQVSSKDGLAWLDLVSSDLEGEDYACGPLDTCAAGVGAPNIRQRLYFAAERVEHSAGDGREQWWAEPKGRRSLGRCCNGGLADNGGAGLEVVGVEHARPERAPAERSGAAGRLALANRRECDRLTGSEGREPDRSSSGRIEGNGQPECGDAAGWLADTNGRNAGSERQQRGGQQRQFAPHGGDSPDSRPGPLNGFWRAADWLLCRDPDGPRWRPVEPGTFPLAHGAPARVGRLRGYGNALNAIQAATFIEAFLDLETIDGVAA